MTSQSFFLDSFQEEEKKIIDSKEILKSVIEAKALEEKKVFEDKKVFSEKKVLEDKKVFEDKKVEDEKKVRKTSQKEFGGTIGVLFFLLALPAIVFSLIQMCHKVQLFFVFILLFVCNVANCISTL